MAGDQLNVSIDYYYTTINASNGNSNGLNTLVNSIAGMILGSDATSSSGSSTGIASNQVGDNSVSTFFLSEQGASTGPGNKPPKAYLHVLLFDERFVFDKDNSFVQQVAYAPNAIQTLPCTLLTVKKSGYAYVYFSNESNTPLYFDNFSLTHVHGALIQTSDYSPFGLNMAAVSSSALNVGQPGNKKLYNGKERQNREFFDGAGLEFYDYGARMQDPQLGRWWSIDPKSEKYRSWSPYVYVADNPIKLIDIDGYEWVDAKGNLIYSNGKYTQYATKNDIAVGDQLRKTTTGQQQFNKLVNSPQKITVTYDQQSPLDEDKNGIQLGGTAPVRKKWKSAEGVQTAEVQSASITLYVNGIDEEIARAKKNGEEPLGDEKITSDFTFIEVLAISLGHEIEHTTDKNNTTDLQKGINAAEDEAYKISNAMIRETKANRKKERNDENAILFWSQFNSWLQAVTTANPDVKLEGF